MGRTARCLLAAGIIAGAIAGPAVARDGRGCADGLNVVIESGSIRAAARPARITEEQMEALRQAAGRQFKEVAASLCRAGRLPPRRLAPFRQVVILQGSGATEPVFFRPEREFGGEALAFQYVWAETARKLPPRAEVEAALACWAADTCEPLN
ncbi:MAG: hypothetical protein ACK40H_02575 [Sphingomonadaceae bacterium]